MADQATKKRAVTGFPAWVVDKPLPDARPEAILRNIESVATPAPDGVEIHVDYTSINFKDALALTGASGVLRTLPLVAGIDAVGRVREAAHGFEAGETLVVTGAGLGERFDGGLSARTVLPAASALRLPDGIDARTAAAVGTAGVTAALAVRRLQAVGVDPSAGRIAVTGAGGGVGAFSVALLAKLGYDVVAVTGRERLHDHLIGLGAAEVVGRDAIGSERGAPLQKARWAAAIDSAGGVPLANLLSQTAPGGYVAACGLAASADLPTTVLPFILRGVSLLGVNSVDASRASLESAWDLIRTLDQSVFAAIAPRTEPLSRAVPVARDLLAGKVDGRTVITLHP